MAYRDTVIADGASAYWRLNETSGTTANDSVGTRHATISGPVTLGVPGPTQATAFSFDATGTGILTPPSCPPFGAAWSLEAWVKWDGTLAGTPRDIMARQIFADGDFQWYLQGSATILRLLYFSGSSQTRDLIASLPTNVWLHLVVTAGAGQVIYYQNGVASGSPQATVIGGAGAGPFTLAGASDASNYGWRGQLSDLAIYPTALTPAKIAAHYAAATAVASTARRISFGMWRQILP